ncbi:MAG: glycosyltransferase family 2 protein [Prevotellaceae bacterium]|nr:glycosyltransferase family 2 protein [Candidatus Faecinaster equi]
MKPTHNLAILLATYNGETFLREQLNSLLSQSYQDWQLFIHDDGSTDNTISILKEYEAKHPRIQVLNYPPTGGACRNFLSLFQRVQASYYMFCDQDDVWLPDKIERQMQLMHHCEQQFPDLPIIIHSDLQVVDAQLKTIAPSFWQYEHINPDRYQCWEDFAHGCLTTGCTMLFNQKTKDITLPIAKTTLMHDEWVTLCTIAHNGRVIALPEPTILYRQHGTNTLGAQNATYRHSIPYLCSHIKQILQANIAHYHQMKAIRPISIFSYIKHKLL